VNGEGQKFLGSMADSTELRNVNEHNANEVVNQERFEPKNDLMSRISEDRV
jgi:hypothetical protein